MYRIEKIEGDVAVITLKEQTITIDSTRLPAGAREGEELDISTITPFEPIMAVSTEPEDDTEIPESPPELTDIAEEMEIEKEPEDDLTVTESDLEAEEFNETEPEAIDSGKDNESL